MKIVKFKDEAQRLNVSVEAVRIVLEEAVEEGKICGIIDYLNQEIIVYEPEEMKSLATRLISGSVSVEQLSNELNLKKEHVELIVTFLEEKGFSGSLGGNRDFIPIVSAKEKEAFLCPFCGAPYKEIIPQGTFQVKCQYCAATILVPRKLGGLFQCCTNHHETIAVGMCNDCGKSFCGDCLYVVRTPGYYQQLPEYSYYCSECLEIKGLKRKTSMVPTVRMVTEKLAVLNARVQRFNTTISPQQAEDLYRRMRIPTTDYFTGRATKESEMDVIIEKYIKSGLSRKDAILEMARERGIELRPGLRASPTIDDAYVELQQEIKKGERAKRERQLRELELSKECEDFYNELRQLYVYTHGGRSSQVLEGKIKSLTERGMSREGAILELAEKEGLIKKDA